MTRSSILRTLLTTAVVLAVTGASGRLDGQEGTTFSVALGRTGAGGDWGVALQDGTDVEVNITYLSQSGLRLGAGAYYVSYNLEPQFGDAHVSNVQLQALAGYTFRFGRVRPYLQARAAILRLRLEGEHGTPAPQEGDNTEPKRMGAGAVVLSGIEFAAFRQVSLDANVWYGVFRSAEVDLSPIGGPPISNGNAWGVRLGLSWYPKP